MMVFLIVLLAVAAVIAGSVSVSVALEGRASSRRATEAIADYQIADVRQQEMLPNVGSRVLAPVGAALLRIANRYTPAGYTANLKRRIVLAGNPPGIEADRFRVLKVLGAGSGLIWVPLVLLLDLDWLLTWIAIGLLWTVSFLGPDLYLDRKMRDRQKEIAKRLPDTLDLLVISVEAGLGFEQALDRTVETVPGPLADEMRRMLQETRMGATRAEALRALDERTQVEELRSFILAMLQADTFGVSVARILRNQAEKARTRRRLVAEEQAQKAPVRMLFPLVFCIFPAVFVVVLVPALINIFDSL
jgi:tight adherence protein C